MATGSYSERSYPLALQRGARWPGIALALVLHAVVIGALLSLAPVRTNAIGAMPIEVRLVAPPVSPPRPKPTHMAEPLPVKPRVPPPKPITPAPVITTAAEAPATSVIPSPPLPAAEPARESVAVAAQAAAPAPTSAAAPPPPIVPPTFNANYLANPAPEYPALSRRMGEEGKVVLRVFVSEQGLAAQIEMRASSGHARLDEAALNTVKHWKFVPARRSDTPVGAWVLVPIAFSLRS